MCQPLKPNARNVIDENRDQRKTAPKIDRVGLARHRTPMVGEAILSFSLVKSSFCTRFSAASAWHTLRRSGGRDRCESSPKTREADSSLLDEARDQSVGDGVLAGHCQPVGVSAFQHQPCLLARKPARFGDLRGIDRNLSRLGPTHTSQHQRMWEWPRLAGMKAHLADAN